MSYTKGTSGWRWMDIAAGEVGTAYYPTDGKGGKTATAAESIASKSRLALGYVSLEALPTTAGQDVVFKSGSTTFCTVTVDTGDTLGNWFMPIKDTTLTGATVMDTPNSTKFNETFGLEMPDLNVTVVTGGSDTLAIRVYYRLV